MKKLVRSARLLVCFLVCYTVSAAATPPRSVSSSRQFIVFGANNVLRGVVADAAEQLKSKLLAALQIPDRWSVPILLNLLPREANVPEVPQASLNFSQTGAGLKLQIDLVIDRDFNTENFQREILRTLFLEMTYRNQPALPAGTPYASPPEWLVEGVATLNCESPQLWDALVNIAAHPPALRNVVTEKPALLDPQLRIVFSASANALLKILLAQPGGRAEIVRYIERQSHFSNDAMAEFYQSFPEFAREESAAEKNWRSGLARVVKEEQFALLSFPATADELDNCLRRPIARAARNNPLSLTVCDANRITRGNLDSQAAHELAERLMILAAHAHPLLRAIVSDYQRAAELLARKQIARVGKIVSEAASLRVRLAERLREVDDYMNWFEATQAKTSSGVFTEYFRAAEPLLSRRHDPLSVYLDAMETQFE